MFIAVGGHGPILKSRLSASSFMEYNLQEMLSDKEINKN